MNSLLYYCAVKIQDFTLLHIVAANDSIANEIAASVLVDDFQVLANDGKYYTSPHNIKNAFSEAGVKQGYLISNKGDSYIAMPYITRVDIIDEILKEL